jgi:hypothetical protein
MTLGPLLMTLAKDKLLEKKFITQASLMIITYNHHYNHNLFIVHATDSGSGASTMTCCHSVD